MKSRKTIAGDSITIKITDRNSFLVSHVYCWLKKENKLSVPEAGKEGVIAFTRQPADSILLVFEFCPERSSSYATRDANNNYFEFGFEPWLLEVFFKDFLLQVNETELHGKHPLMGGQAFITGKVNEGKLPPVNIILKK